MLITSRGQAWAEVAVPVTVDVLARAESAAILQGRVSGLGASDADRLAVELGDLPLAVAQAAGFMAETGMPAGQYLHLLATRAGTLLDQVPSGASYPRSLAAVTNVPGVLPAELAARAADPLAWRQVLARLARQSLARVDSAGW